MDFKPGDLVRITARYGGPITGTAYNNRHDELFESQTVMEVIPDMYGSTKPDEVVLKDPTSFWPIAIRDRYLERVFEL